MLLCIGAFVVSFLAAYAFSDRLILFILKPLKDAAPTLKLATLSLTEGFVTTLKLALYAAFILCLPVTLWQCWRFIEPGLVQREKVWFKTLLFPMIGAFFVGTAFCYFAVLPMAIRFFLTDLGNSFQIVFSYGAYVDFSVVFLLIMGLMFQLPLLIALLDSVGLVPVHLLQSHRRHTIVGAFILGAIFSPPDVVSQILVSVPLILLLEAGIQLAHFFRKRQIKDSSREADIQKVEIIQ